eukprot:CAMPEP_0177566268 /NCGR_PEP_ID=MMETSP0369-20130122/74582_1 /TAXON_ID=447022 ORGANISM="Scrippsiella hangoei-like, Strain SHHI-4" /NCGR_SAMPLE_ID=MMETSP0369 /ASSEMBLY_ACC=CAM_ASM_000364 /LENGTH=132 /DNA_ID=CAMNT_0019053659 /DNA_START=183 /DNA_END=577 /DNA_ORIENTATION=+
MTKGIEKSVALDQDVPVVVPLDHAEVVQRVLAVRELEHGADGRPIQEGGAEVVSDGANGVVHVVVRRRLFRRVFPNLEERELLRLVEGPDLKCREVDVVDLALMGHRKVSVGAANMLTYSGVTAILPTSTPP